MIVGIRELEVRSRGASFALGFAETLEKRTHMIPQKMFFVSAGSSSTLTPSGTNALSDSMYLLKPVERRRFLDEGGHKVAQNSE